ncbi:MAG: glycine cleavage system aminomethyltransferase GcvT [Synechococcales cyanobacterium CRU_2_2]|nr:glycine cleavage system aminomethyltransferase GcvT [Synechococcales cyanobacterium CRU_2_2]
MLAERSNRDRPSDIATRYRYILKSVSLNKTSVAEFQSQAESQAKPLLRTPLSDLIKASGARMVPFAGWEMPVQFIGLSQEHEAVRTGVGLFDISHMGKFFLSGQGILEALSGLVPTDLSELRPGQAQYTVLLNPEGGIIDDLIVYLQGGPGQAIAPERVALIVNAATQDKDKTWLLSHFPEGITLDDRSETHVLVAVQGPQAVVTLQTLVPGADLAGVGRFGHLETEILGREAFLARTGYTGEDGFEVMIPKETGEALWQALVAAGAVPCGLGARDTLRLEAAMSLYGNDIDDQTTPLEAGLGWLVHLDRKGDFVGRSVLEAQQAGGVERRLVAIEMEGRNIARHGYAVVDGAGVAIGEVTSGTWSPTLQKAIALAYVPTELAKVGTAIVVEIRNKPQVGRVVKKPFYRSNG